MDVLGDWKVSETRMTTIDEIERVNVMTEQNNKASWLPTGTLDPKHTHKTDKQYKWRKQGSKKRARAFSNPIQAWVWKNSLSFVRCPWVCCPSPTVEL